MRIAFTTFGCKINQYETDLLRQDFEARGNIIVPFDAEADVYIINTCSVTAKSDQQCRQTIKQAVRRGKDSKVVVTGCYAATQPDEIKKIPGVDLVCGNNDKSKIPEQIMTSLDSRGSVVSNSMPATFVRRRTRGFLKIQDGCNNRCSYCIVPLARGNSRSVLPTDIIAAFDRFVADGCPEIVLTGIHVGTYGIDLPERSDLTKLLIKLIDRRGSSRIRLSSIEPNEITAEMIAMLGNGLCRHLHIPLQSGDDAVLKSMKRHYTSGFYLDLLEKIAKQVPAVALGADIMVGYPGEGDEQFENTLRLVEKAPLTHLHIFSYSSRPGTVAAAMKEQVPEKVKKERSEVLRDIGRRKNLAFRRSLVNAELKMVVEDKAEACPDMASGLTDNYVRVSVFGVNMQYIGKEITIRINDANSEGNFATIL